MAPRTALRWTLAGDEAQAPLFDDGLPSGARDLPAVEYLRAHRLRTIVMREMAKIMEPSAWQWLALALPV
jgi:hypothetical protein